MKKVLEPSTIVCVHEKGTIHSIKLQPSLSKDVMTSTTVKYHSKLVLEKDTTQSNPNLVLLENAFMKKGVAKLPLQLVARV